ncbi:hypothetical protein GLOIN_2v1781358 [Rhizophagus irregularis DAOM 181602=DAOM 197198]|nr:hypothetical protein GLOIN_2v1781358 [Rhizophagus irregularis DAOM 181602=DAOM 197198]
MHFRYDLVIFTRNKVNLFDLTISELRGLGILVKCSMDYKGARVLKRLKKRNWLAILIRDSTRRPRNLTKNFQAQFKQLQASKASSLNHRSIDNRLKPVRPKPRPRVVQDHQDPDWDDGGGFRIFKMTPIKIPVKVTSSKPTLIKAVTKNDSLSLLRRDIREDDPMDIDIARLENTKDLLALDGKVNGIAIQCLADTCANASFIQREALKNWVGYRQSITHNISGAPGSGRTFGMHREIGLSRTCLKRYNYDVHESREHIALTCNEKNVFIPIVSDVNRGDKK